MDIYDAAARYVKNEHSLIILAGKDYGSGKSTFILVITTLYIIHSIRIKSWLGCKRTLDISKCVSNS